MVSRLTAIRDRMLANEPTGADFGSDLDPRLTYRQQLSEPLAKFAELCSQLDTEADTGTSLRPLLDTSGLRFAHSGNSGSAARGAGEPRPPAAVTLRFAVWLGCYVDNA